MNKLEISPDHYFNLSLKSLGSLNFETAIDFIDLAITNTTEKEFYMFQKIKILFIASLFSKCAHYIEENLTHFYQQTSLNIFSQILHYYQQSTKSSIDFLCDLLIQKDIPPALAYQYIAIIHKEDDNFLEKATDAMEAGDYIACIHYCDLIFKHKSPPITAYLLKGKCHQILGEYDLAIRIYKKALIGQPNLAPIYHNLAIIRLKLKQYAKAICACQQSIRIEPSNVVYRTLLAESFYKWRKYDSALINFKKVIAQNPNCTEAYLRIADIYNLTQNPKKAKRYYKKILRLQAHGNPI